MEEVPVTKIEFFGGPEDGRVLDAEVFEDFAEAVAEEGAESIPMMVQEDAPGDEERGEFQFIGLYVAKETIGSTLQYHWAGIRS
jgi:hypothetical protein